MRFAFLLSTALLAGCGGEDTSSAPVAAPPVSGTPTPTPTATPTPTPATGLIIGPWIKGKTYSPGYPKNWPRTGAGWVIDFAPDKELSAVIDERFVIPPTATKLRFHYRATIERVWPDELPDKAPLVSVMIQRRGDDWSGQGLYEFYRFYSPAFPLETGEHVREIPLEGWTGVFGRTGDMRAAITDLGSVSVIFGHSSGRAHGVRGAGRFETLSLEALP